ncbi:hypothetical protein ACHAXT_012244 [Thalassiosira profunda]
MVHLLFLVVAIVASLLPPGATGFSPAPRRTSRASVHPTQIISDAARRRCISTVPSAAAPTALRSTDDKQAEIAALEEKLRQLKEEEPAEAASAQSVAVAAEPSTSTDEPDGSELEGESEDSVMFSERWKEAKDGYVEKQQEESMGGLAKVAAGLGLVVLLALFSQVPVGEENLQRYQDVKGNPSRIDLGDLNPVQ